MDDERTDCAEAERAEEELDRRWVRILDRNLPDPAVTREHRAWWRMFLARLEDMQLPQRDMPAARRKLARTLRWARWPMAESWEAVVRDPSEYVAAVLSWITIRWDGDDGLLYVPRNRVSFITVPRLLQWYRWYEQLVDMPPEDVIVVLWWARWPAERRPSGREDRPLPGPQPPAGLPGGGG